MSEGRFCHDFLRAIVGKVDAFRYEREEVGAMTKEIEVAFVRDLLTRVGAHLQELDLPSPGTELEEMFQRFESANGWAKEVMQTALTNEYPQIQWSDSEFDLDKQHKAEFAGAYWICDPIDGAVHYLQGFGFWSISLCLVREGQVAVSFVYDPTRQEFFHAIAGEGAYLNGERVQVAQKEMLAHAVVGTSHPANVAKDIEVTTETSEALARVMPKVFALRMLGSVSLQLAYVACGRLDGYWEFGYDMYDWLAGAFLVQEAGGQLTGTGGQAFTWGTTGIIAAHAELNRQLQQELLTT
jgi:myo-inositol-1(or 4)-monophosphatase